MWAGPQPPLTNDTLPLAALLSNDCSLSVRSSPITFVKISFLKTLAAQEVLGYKIGVFYAVKLILFFLHYDAGNSIFIHLYRSVTE